MFDRNLPPLKLLKTIQEPARKGGTCFALFYKNPETGKAWKQWVYPSYNNYANWRYVIEQSYVGKKVMMISNLVARSWGLVDSDSNPHIDSMEEAQVQSDEMMASDMTTGGDK